MLRPAVPSASSSSIAARTICSRLRLDCPPRVRGGRVHTEWKKSGLADMPTMVAALEQRAASMVRCASQSHTVREKPVMPERNPRRWLILGVLCLSLLVVVIDNMVLNIAIPSLIRDLGASTSEIQWIIDAYILVFAGLLLTAGSLSDRHGRRLGLIVGLAVFGGASVLATLSQTPGQLIAARGLMGVGAAFLMPGTLSILTTVFAEDERKKAIAIWSSVLMLGALGGPSLGGLLLEHFWWGSIFLLNVPIALLGIVAALVVIPESHGTAGRPDLLGALLSMIGMTALVWGVISSAQHGFTSVSTLGGFAVAVAGLAAFAIWERRVAEPMLPLKLFRNRNFA